MKLGKVMLIAAAGAALALWLREHVEITFNFQSPEDEPGEPEPCEPEEE